MSAQSASGKQAGDLGEGVPQLFDLLRRRRGADEHHVVEGRDQATTNEQRQMDRALERGRVRSLGFGSVTQGARCADELDARADTSDVPRQAMLGDRVLERLREYGRESLHVVVRRGRHDPLEAGTHRGERKRVGRQRRADARVSGRGLCANGVESARDRLSDINPHVKIETYETRLTSENALRLFRDVDIVADGTDNFPTRYLVNDACVLAGKPNVYVSIFRFEGQASVFWAARGACNA